MATTIIDPTASAPLYSAPDKDKELILQQTASGSLDWTFAIFLLFFHAGAVAALFFFSWKALAITAVFWVIAQNGASPWPTIAC